MISVQNISFRYPNSENIFENLSLDIVEGSFTSIMGANGSGKSTLARCLNGLLQPVSGTVTVDDLSVADVSLLPAIRKEVGFVFQDPNTQMTSATIERELAFGLQNYGLPADEVRSKVEVELQRIRFAEKRGALPSTLSGGEKQRLALASVLMLDPKYLILDEPTSFLSPSSRRNLIAELEQRKGLRNTAIVLITQFLREALRADRLIVLHDSRIAFDDVPQNILKSQTPLDNIGLSAHSFSSSSA